MMGLMRFQRKNEEVGLNKIRDWLGISEDAGSTELRLVYTSAYNTQCSHRFVVIMPVEIQEQ